MRITNSRFMKPALLNLLTLLALAAALAGCGQKDRASDTHGEADHSHNADGSHSDSAQTFSGATHKEGTGITLLEETRQLLGIQTADVQAQILPRSIRFTARVFATGHTASATLASGTVSTNDAAHLHSGLPVKFQTGAGITVTGVIQQVSHAQANGETEVIIAFSPTATALKQSDFGEITISLPGEKNVLVVPREAVIKGTTGDLVYAVNGNAYTLTWVQMGTEANGLVEITDGLFAGDSVVTRGAMDLWLVELRAVKGGQGCCPAPPKKGKD